MKKLSAKEVKAVLQWKLEDLWAGDMDQERLRASMAEIKSHWAAVNRWMHHQRPQWNELLESFAAEIADRMRQAPAEEPARPQAREARSSPPPASSSKRSAPPPSDPPARQPKTFHPPMILGKPPSPSTKVPSPAPAPSSERQGSAPPQAPPSLRRPAPPQKESPPTEPPVERPRWEYHAPPEGPEPHEEFARVALRSPEGLRLIGARARGRKHKHEGTHCDDWLELDACGPWTLVAVSDGAGSKRYSRVGARVSCQAALARLRRDLESHRIRKREAWTAESFQRSPEDGTFAEKDLEAVHQALQTAMREAYDAVEEAASRMNEEHAGHPNFQGPVEVKDLSATLLLAVHTTVPYKDCSLVLSCQVGDGMVAAVDRQGGLQLLGTPDSGTYSGETDFLTSREKLEPVHLGRKTFPYFRPLRALMVMTDGVSDDYFPNDPGMLRLFVDLVLNGIVRLKKPSEDAIREALSQTSLGTLQALRERDILCRVERLLADGSRPVDLRSAEAFSRHAGLSMEELAALPVLPFLASQASREGLQGAPEENLEAWLDSYQIRGSFDDRTLAILYREDPA